MMSVNTPELNSVRTGESEIPNRDQRDSSDATLLVKLAEKDCQLWNSGSDGNAYATILIDSHQETHSLKSRQFQRLIGRRFYETYGRVANPNSIGSAISTLEGKAIFEGEEGTPAIRVAGNESKILIDLCNDRWQAIEVTASDVRFVPSVSANFVRPAAMQSLPTPDGTDLDLLRKYINIQDDDFYLMISWLMMALHPSGPYPVLMLSGEQGSAKSTTARMLRSLVDPNRSPIRAAPKSTQDLAIAANNGRVVAFDNLSSISTSLSDALCRLSTGGGFSTRALYANDEEVIFESKRPIILTAIENVASREDLADRTISITLPTIQKGSRRTEKEIWSDFERDAPAIFGGLLELLSAGLRNLDSVFIPELPRMADFAQFATAAETEMGLQPGGWMRLYSQNIQATNQALVDDKPLIGLIRECLQQNPEPMQISDWLDLLESQAEHDPGQKRLIPSTPKALGGELRRLAPVMRRAGIEVDFDTYSNKHRTIIAIQEVDDGGEPRAPQHCGVGGEDSGTSPPDVNDLLDDANLEDSNNV
ncbi:putative ATP-binding protein [Rhodopirellula baltica SH 1]|uniref:ATP-binding protein n=2 Tax=Rhodopirellula baltica TaxID=265606 RepID=Q7UK91_RHOBA|nr:putative ATP-binding protein [Rhodopirellula baltica SH 1]